MVDGNMIMKTSGSDAEFDIREGSRKVTLYSFDRHGKGVYDNVDVTVQKGSATAGPLTVVVVLLLIIIFVPKLLPRFMRSGLSGLIPFGRPSDAKAKEEKR
jgi:hypothetical protein